ncbi:MAG: alpha/beta hydrolase [Bacteroidota bacterium]
MNFKRLFAPLMIAFLSGSISFAQKQVLYKQIDSTKLYMNVYYSVQVDSSIHYPAMIFFFGGGWVRGDRAQFINHAQYFSKRGVTCFLIDYRTKNKDNSTPFESLKDAKSAIRYLRKHADKFNIDTSKIIAVGGSAVGQLAAASALIEDYKEASDDMSISPKPNALVLFNPVVDNGPAEYGFFEHRSTHRDGNWNGGWFGNG